MASCYILTTLQHYTFIKLLQMFEHFVMLHLCVWVVLAFAKVSEDRILVYHIKLSVHAREKSLDFVMLATKTPSTSGLCF